MALLHLPVGFLGVSLLGVICGFQWDPLPNPVLYPCVGKGVTFPWAFQTDQGEKAGDIHWVFDGAFSSQLVATMTHEYFLPTELYSQRVRYVKNGGFSLHDVTFADSGNYTVEIDVVNKDGSFVSHRHSVYLQVADGLLTREGKLTVEQDPRALWDDHTQQWVVRLNCGSFTYLGQPPVHVIWTNSKGETQSSTGYDNGNFFLTLPSPVLGGNYTCHISTHLLSDACFNDLGGDGEDTVKAGVTVDEMKARLTLMEAEQKTLKQDNNRLKEQLSVVKDSHSDDASVFMEHINNLTDYIEDRTRQQIGFHATGLQSSTPPSGTPLIVNSVHYNQGNAYNGTTGYFTTPYPGVYFFAGTTGRSGAGHAYHYLYVDDTQLSHALTYEDQGTPSQSTVHAVVHLTTGQRVHIRSGGSYNYYSSGTSFSGFLISSDP